MVGDALASQTSSTPAPPATTPITPPDLLVTPPLAGSTTRHTSHITSTASGLGSVGLAVSGPGYVVGAANGAGGVTSLPGVFLGLLLVV